MYMDTAYTYLHTLYPYTRINNQSRGRGSYMMMMGYCAFYVFLFLSPSLSSPSSRPSLSPLTPSPLSLTPSPPHLSLSLYQTGINIDPSALLPGATHPNRAQEEKAVSFDQPVTAQTLFNPTKVSIHLTARVCVCGGGGGGGVVSYPDHLKISKWSGYETRGVWPFTYHDPLSWV